MRSFLFFEILNISFHICRRALTPGSFVSLKEVLKTLTGDDEISTDALKEYYEPLMKWLQSYLINNNIDY